MRIFLILLLTLFGFVAKANIPFVVVDDVRTWEELLQLAKKSNKNVLVLIDAKGCQTCKELRKTALKSKSVSDFVKENYLAIQVNLYSTVGKAMATTFRAEDAPTLLVMNAEEVLFEKFEGLTSADELLTGLKTATSIAAEYPRWVREAAKGSLGKDEYIRYLLIEEKNKRVTASHNIVRELASMLDSVDFTKPYVLSFVQQLCVDVDGPVFKTLLKKPYWITDTTLFRWETYRQNVYNYNLAEAIRQKDSVFMEDVLLQISGMPVKPIPNFTLKGRQLYLAELNKWRAYDTLTTAYLYPLPADSADAYQRQAIFLMEYYPSAQPKSLALKYLRRGLAQKETYNLYFTLSLWLYNADDLTNAYKSAFTAEKLAKTSEEKRLARQMQQLIESEFY